MPRILIVDDDRETCRFLEELLASPEREFSSALDPDEAIARIRRGEAFDLLITDLNLNAARSGLDVLRVFKTERPSAQVVLISGFGTLETAVEAVRAGAFDYISKPFSITAVKATVERALRESIARVEDVGPQPALSAATGLLGRTAPMLEVYKQIAQAADSAAPVLVIGESGTGKELVARAIHMHGPRAHDPFVAVNCGAITETLLESELFGHTRGAFTGAVADTKGLFEQAGRGTVFLDEIGETSPGLQVKLLRVLEENEVRAVGAARAIRVHARVIAATNVDIERESSADRFRRDLYYRISVIVIRVPPLRERRSDIPLLISTFLERAAARAGRRATLSAEALDAFMRYAWPGNVRELENIVERVVLANRGAVVDLADLPSELLDGSGGYEERLFADLPTLDEVERRYLLHVLEAVGGSRTRAAEVLRIDRRTLYRMAERFGISLKD
jgi:DNA-binding NtrC family response regulator